MFSDGILAKLHCIEAINKVSSLNRLDRGRWASLVAWAYQEGIFTLPEIADLSHALLDFLKVLQCIRDLNGESSLSDAFDSSTIRLLDYLPESDRNEANLGKSLEECGLTFLMPLLKIRKDMEKQLEDDPDPSRFLHWIHAHLNIRYEKLTVRTRGGNQIKGIEQFAGGWRDGRLWGAG